MRFITPALVLASLGISSLFGQARIDRPRELVTNWYQRYLDRHPDQGGLAGWSAQLRAGKPAVEILSRIIGSPEYFQRSGSNNPGFVRTFYSDALGRGPTPQELQFWVGRLDDVSRHELARSFLSKHPTAWQPVQEPVESDYLAGVVPPIRRLNYELENLQEDILSNVRGIQERELYFKADKVLKELRDFKRSLDRRSPRQQIRVQYQQMDGRLHDLVRQVRDIGHRYPILRRDAQRIERVDRQLHYAVLGDDRSKVLQFKLIARQAGALETECRKLYRIGHYTNVDRALKIVMYRLIEASDRFARSVESNNLTLCRQRFVEFDRCWVMVVKQLHAMEPWDNWYLLRVAQEIEPVHDRLHSLLGVKGQRRPLVIRGNWPKAVK